MQQCQSKKGWYKVHEGWVGALILALGAYALGVLTATVVQAHMYNNQVRTLSDSFNVLIVQKDMIINHKEETIRQKDELVKSLSTSTAKASNAAASASQAAIKASDTKDKDD